MSLMRNAPVWRVSGGGGAVQVKTDASGNAVITTSYPCRQAYVQAVGSSLSSVVYMNIGTDASTGIITCECTNTAGIRIPIGVGSAVISDAAGAAEIFSTQQWFTIPIDDLARLHFHADGANELVDILYRA